MRKKARKGREKNRSTNATLLAIQEILLPGARKKKSLVVNLTARKDRGHWEREDTPKTTKKTITIGVQTTVGVKRL